MLPLFAACETPNAIVATPALATPTPPEGSATDADKAGLQVSGVTYAMAQQVRWLDEQRFLVGRWDGTISLFEVSSSSNSPPKLLAAMSMPSGEGVQMLVTGDATTFVSSDREDSLMTWRKETGDQFLPELVPYPGRYGFAVSGLFVDYDEKSYLVTGHEHGDLLIWSVGTNTKLSLLRAVNLRMRDAIDYLHAEQPLRHIRGLAAWKDGIVIAGGEDGGLHQVRITDGVVLSQRLFNANARLGVNDLAVHGDNLLVVNCAIGQQDWNVWLYGLSENQIENRDSANLLRNPNIGRIFAFDIITYEQKGESYALVTTKEGLLWRLRFADGELDPLESLPLGRFHYGNAIDYNERSRSVAAAGISVRVVAINAD
ncbi:MAG: WD40 repeat domain-containing protein [Pseudomonadota bacterium]